MKVLLKHGTSFKKAEKIIESESILSNKDQGIIFNPKKGTFKWMFRIPERSAHKKVFLQVIFESQEKIEDFYEQEIDFFFDQKMINKLPRAHFTNHWGFGLKGEYSVSVSKKDSLNNLIEKFYEAMLYDNEGNIYNELVSSKIDKKNFNKYLLGVYVNKEKIMERNPENYESIKEFMKLNPQINFIKSKSGLKKFLRNYF